jgi:hypothetical protein
MKKKLKNLKIVDFLSIGLMGPLIFMFLFWRCTPTPSRNSSYESVKSGFLNPPVNAKPKGYWVWPKGYFDIPSLEYDIKEAAEKGMGGLEIFDINSVDMENKIPAGPGFMSDSFLDAVAFAEQKCKEYGLELGLIISSSWNTGAEWIPDSLGTMGLFQSETIVYGAGETEITLPDPETPDYVIKNLKKLNQDPTLQNYYTVSVVAIPNGSNGNYDLAQTVYAKRR